ncbi:MAG: hypothetical protein AB9856_06650 [Cellulosilyticaceae bacterium]
MNVCTRIAKIFELLGSLDGVKCSCFARNRKMPLKEVLKYILIKKGKTLTVKLYDYFRD